MFNDNLDQIISDLTIYTMDITFILEENSSGTGAAIIALHQKSIISRSKSIDNARLLISKIANKFNVEFDQSLPISAIRRPGEWITEVKLIGSKDNIGLLKMWWVKNNESLPGIEIIEKPNTKNTSKPKPKSKPDPMIQTIHIILKPGKTRNRIIENWRYYKKSSKNNINGMEKFIATNIDTLHINNFRKHKNNKQFRSKLNDLLKVTPTIEV